jgi:hypothetical protein
MMMIFIMVMILLKAILTRIPRLEMAKKLMKTPRFVVDVAEA